MKISILAIGNELLNGQTLNTNTHFLNKELAQIGLIADYNLSVNDKPQKILESLKFIHQVSDIIIIIGGLGPTVDDITRDVVAQFTNKKIFLNKKQYQVIQNQAKKYHQIIKPANARRQAMLIDGGQFIPNNVGYAAGIELANKSKIYFLLPGPPREFKAMVKNELIKRFKPHNIIQQTVFNICGLSETKIQDIIIPLLPNDINFAICDNLGEVRLTLSNQDKKQLTYYNQKVKIKLADFLLPKPTLEESIAFLLKKNKWTLATAESCTGGMISSRLTKLPGSSKFYQGSLITYSDQWKLNKLNVSQKLIDKYSAISEEVATAMAKGLQRNNIDCGIATTGITGPNPLNKKAVGLVYIATFTPDKFQVKKFNFNGNRQDIRYRSTMVALNQLRLQIT